MGLHLVISKPITNFLDAVFLIESLVFIVKIVVDIRKELGDPNDIT